MGLDFAFGCTSVPMLTSAARKYSIVETCIAKILWEVLSVLVETDFKPLKAVVLMKMNVNRVMPVLKTPLARIGSEVLHVFVTQDTMVSYA